MTTGPRAQRRARRIAMTDEERDRHLREARTIRVATADATGRPHVMPMWFLWDGAHVWLNSLVSSRRWDDLRVNPRVALVADAGEEYGELHGVEMYGLADFVGEAPRRGDPVAELEPVETAYAVKYGRALPLAHDGRHAWIRVTPQTQFTWDFRKIPFA